MNKEEMFKNLSDKDKKEVLSLMSFMKKIKEQDRKKELYATYEEYLDLIHISEHLSNENEKLQSQLDIANKKLEEIKEYCNKTISNYKKEISKEQKIIDNPKATCKADGIAGENINEYKLKIEVYEEILSKLKESDNT